MKNNNQELNFKKFLDIYKEKVIPEFKKHEQHRISLLEKHKKYKIRFVIPFTLSIIIMLAMPIKFMSMSLNTDMDTLKVMIVLGVIFWISSVLLTIWLLPPLNKCNNEIKKLRNELKDNLMGSILQTFGNIKWIKHDKNEIWSFFNDEFDRSGLFLKFNRIFLDDEFKGVYKNVPFNIYEVKLYNYADKNSYTAFKGVIINYKYNKKIKNRTVVAAKGSNTKAQNFINSIFIFALFSLASVKCDYLHVGQVFVIIVFLTTVFSIIIFLTIALIEPKRKKYEEPLNKIELEDPVFNKRFNVYSSDEVEARYIVTPLFMELFSNLKTSFGIKELKCSFFDDNFMIAISTQKDLFEIGDLNMSYDNPKCILQFWRQLFAIYKMIEYFKLNEKIYTQ